MNSIFCKVALPFCLVAGVSLHAAAATCRPFASEATIHEICIPPLLNADGLDRSHEIDFLRTTAGSSEANVPASTDSSVAVRVGGTVRTTVNVEAKRLPSDSIEGFERRITTTEIEKSAGTFGDPSRFLQMLPGVVSDNDQRNDFLVRGGNPSENQFVIDNIEVPSINQLALSDTTGGFVSMIDTNAIQQMTLHTDAYDSKFNQRLSSVVEISTRPEGKVKAHTVAEFGIAGTGASMSRSWGNDGSLLVSARQSVLQYMTNDIGMNGVPSYRNFLVRGENRVGENDSWWGMSLTGIDSIKIRPESKDWVETNPFDIDYSGWRNTTGLNWQHLFSPKTFGVLSLANSQQSQSVLERDQQQADATVYNEQTSDGTTTLKYDWTMEQSKWLRVTAGGREAVNRINYLVDQPIGSQNPYSESPLPMDATTLNRRFVANSSAVYGQAAVLLPHGVKIVMGDRVMQWSLGGGVVSAPKVMVAAPVFGKLFHAGFAEYAQPAPTLFLLTFDNQHTLKPIRARHFTGGVDLLDTRIAKISVEAYEKRYTDYPVAQNYPQLSMANIADTFGQEFLMFPMTSAGLGLSRGVEMSVATKLTSKFTMTETATYSRSWYSGLDGVLRRGNLDLPVVVNVAGDWRIRRGMGFSFRYTGASGRPYTPDNLVLSTEQNRDVYDLTRINAVRAVDYSRLDFRFERTSKLGRGHLTWHIGLENALGSSNFYANMWRPNLQRFGKTNITSGTEEQTQMPRFPDGGLKYEF